MGRKRVVLIGSVSAVVVCVVAAVVWFGPFRSDPAPEPLDLSAGGAAYQAAETFAAAWVDGGLDTVAVTDRSGDVAGRSLLTTIGIGPSAGLAPAEVTVLGLEEVAEAGGGGEPADEPAPPRVSARLGVVWQLDPGRDWTYETVVELEHQAAIDSDSNADVDAAWLVDWTPTVVHPRLGEGDVISTVRVTPTRAEILGPDGQPLVSLRPVVIVGIQPGLTEDRAATAEEVAEIVGVDVASLVERVEAATDTDVVSVVTLREEAFAALPEPLDDIAGVVLRTDEVPLAPTRNFARALLGTVGEADEEVAIASGGRVQVGEVAGLSGLQAAQDEVLGGKAGLSIRADRTASEQEALVLQDYPAEPGQPVTITLDLSVQAAADAVMAEAPNPAALVPIRVSTGDVVAVSNGPVGADGYNRAMIGRYPPGSTFKVASTFALLQAGLTPDTVVPCPATIVVGKEFSNAEGAALGDVAFRTDFAESCNTAFVDRSRSIMSAQLTEAAADLGFRELDLGMPLVLGSVPETGDETEHAANMIGQGKVEASPLVVALMSASVAAGRSLEPRLIVDPANPTPAPGAELPAGPIGDLQALMRAAVTEGTGSAVRDVPGGEVSGKTGTAEYGTEVPPRTHAWFTGFQGDVAFAVLVEDGASGGQVAAPLAAAFLELLAP